MQIAVGKGRGTTRLRQTKGRGELTFNFLYNILMELLVCHGDTVSVATI